MFDPIKFFQPAYLFDFRPFTSFSTIKAMMIFFSLLTLAGIAVKIYKEVKIREKFEAKLLEKIVSLLIVSGLLGIGLTWLRYERVQILSARFWLIVWLVIVLIALYPIVSYWLKVLPEAKKRAAEKKLLTSYLPKKKN